MDRLKPNYNPAAKSVKCFIENSLVLDDRGKPRGIFHPPSIENGVIGADGYIIVLKSKENGQCFPPIKSKEDLDKLLFSNPNDTQKISLASLKGAVGTYKISGEIGQEALPISFRADGDERDANGAFKPGQGFTNIAQLQNDLRWLTQKANVQIESINTQKSKSLSILDGKNIFGVYAQDHRKTK